MSLPPARLGPMALQPGVTRTNALTLLGAAFLSIGVVTFISVMQPYLLTENLRLPVGEQGAATGILAFAFEATVMLFVAPYGALADKIGRRPIFALGFLWAGMAMAMYPLAETLSQLVLCRMVFAVGSAAVTGMLATVLADYPRECSRGLMVAASGICNGLGAMVFVLLLSRLPEVFAAMGYSTLAAGRLTFWVAATLCAMSALVVFLGLKTGTPGASRTRQGLSRLLREGAAAVRGNPRIALAYATSFVARGDLMLVSTFFALWAKQAGLDQGLTLEQASARIGLFIPIISAASLLWAPVWGPILDRLDRTTAVAIAMAMAGGAYLVAGFSPNPIANAFMPVAVMLGIGEFSAILAGATLIGQEAPESVRGSVVGLFNLCGSVGVLCISLVAGYVFDHWMPSAPFIVVGFANLFLVGMALRVKRQTGYRPPAGAEPSH
jgi:MFS family permease